MKNKTLRVILAAWMLAVCTQYAQALDLGVSFATYNTPDGKPYIEVNLEIAAVSILYKKTEGEKLQAGAEILIMVKKATK